MSNGDVNPRLGRRSVITNNLPAIHDPGVQYLAVKKI